MSGRTSLRKAWEVLFPYLLYYLAYNAVYLILAFVYQATVNRFGGEYEQFMVTHAATVTGVLGGLCMMIAVLPLVPMLREELRKREMTCGVGILPEADSMAFAAVSTTSRCQKGRISALTVILAFCTSLGLNALLMLTGFAEGSRTYQGVADRQYSVAFAVGLVLYGLISPLAEEVVFRGVIYNRLRRIYNPAVGIVASGIIFGAIHGNLVQGVYGACLGMLMAYLYERSGNFRIPVLFHAVANLAVYTTAGMEDVQEILFTPIGCVVLLAFSAGCVLAERQGGKAGGTDHGEI